MHMALCFRHRVKPHGASITTGVCGREGQPIERYRRALADGRALNARQVMLGGNSFDGLETWCTKQNVPLNKHPQNVPLN
eukprot:COSAG01_NODE_156_length_23748_cov_439.062371_8_plen_80_part_00